MPLLYHMVQDTVHGKRPSKVFKALMHQNQHAIIYFVSATTRGSKGVYISNLNKVSVAA